MTKHAIPRSGPARLTGLLAGLAAAGATASCQTAVEPSPANEGWALVWSDEFDTPVLDRSKWNVEVDCWGGGNEERQCYTDRPQNFEVRDGKLVIIARQETMTGPALPPHMEAGLPEQERGRTATKPFTSARLTTKGKGDWLYGRIEVRARAPQGQGTWAAIWMLPTENYYGGWAASGEIDIMEAVNLGAPCPECPGGVENRILGTIHFGSVWPRNRYTGRDTVLPPSADGYHTYAIDWAPGRITWYVDGRAYSTLTPADWPTEVPAGLETPNAPFDRPFHLILNLAIGGHLSESRNARGLSTDGFPKAFEIDWVRVYQQKDPAP